MNALMADTKDIIQKLKQYAKTRGLDTPEEILAFITDPDTKTSPVSLSTIRRVFKEGSEDGTFRWESTLRPLADALLDVDQQEESDDAKTQSYKSFLKFKRDIIAEKDAHIKELEEKCRHAKEKHNEMLAEETQKFQKSLNFLKEQIELKDKRIDILLEANERLSITNNKLLEQFLECPLKNGDCQN